MPSRSWKKRSAMLKVEVKTAGDMKSSSKSAIDEVKSRVKVKSTGCQSSVNKRTMERRQLPEIRESGTTSLPNTATSGKVIIDTRHENNARLKKTSRFLNKESSKSSQRKMNVYYKNYNKLFVRWLLVILSSFVTSLLETYGRPHVRLLSGTSTPIIIMNAFLIIRGVDALEYTTKKNQDLYATIAKNHDDELNDKDNVKSNVVKSNVVESNVVESNVVESNTVESISQQPSSVATMLEFTEEGKTMKEMMNENSNNKEDSTKNDDHKEYSAKNNDHKEDSAKNDDHKEYSIKAEKNDKCSGSTKIECSGHNKNKSEAIPTLADLINEPKKTKSQQEQDRKEIRRRRLRGSEESPEEEKDQKPPFWKSPWQWFISYVAWESAFGISTILGDVWKIGNIEHKYLEIDGEGKPISAEKNDDGSEKKPLLNTFGKKVVLYYLWVSTQLGFVYAAGKNGLKIFSDNFSEQLKKLYDKNMTLNHFLESFVVGICFALWDHYEPWYPFTIDPFTKVLPLKLQEVLGFPTVQFRYYGETSENGETELKLPSEKEMGESMTDEERKKRDAESAKFYYRDGIKNFFLKPFIAKIDIAEMSNWPKMAYRELYHQEHPEPSEKTVVPETSSFTEKNHDDTEKNDDDIEKTNSDTNTGSTSTAVENKGKHSSCTEQTASEAVKNPESNNEKSGTTEKSSGSNLQISEKKTPRNLRGIAGQNSP